MLSPGYLPTQEIPEEIRAVLCEAAEVNANYDIRSLSADVRSDIYRCVFTSSESRNPERVRSDRVDAFCADVRARIDQIRQAKRGVGSLWTRRDRGVRPATFKASRRTAVKSFSESLSHPADRVALADDEIPRQFQLLPEIIIDPLRIPRTLLERLGFKTDSPQRGELGKVQSGTAAIPQIKVLLANIEPIQIDLQMTRYKKHAYRLYRITRGKRRGMILGLQEFGGRESIFLTDLHGARLRFKKIEIQYVREKEELLEICSALEHVNAEFSQIESVLSYLDELIGRVLYVKNPWKKKLKNALEKARGFLAQESPNTGAARACINDVRIQTFAAKRIAEIDDISGMLGRDKSTLSGDLERESDGAEDLYMSMNKKRAVFETMKNIKEAPVQDIERLRIEIRRIRRGAGALWYNPYKTFGDRIADALDSVDSNLNADGINDAKRRVELAYSYSKFARVWRILMSIYDAVSLHGDGRIDLTQWKELLERMVESSGIKEISPRAYIMEHEKLWEEIKDLCSTLLLSIDVYGKADAPEFTGDCVQHRQRCIEAIKTAIKKFDLPSRAKSLQLWNLELFAPSYSM